MSIDKLSKRLRAHQDDQAKYRGGLERIEKEMLELGIEDPEEAEIYLERERDKVGKLAATRNELIEEAEELLEEYENDPSE